MTRTLMMATAAAAAMMAATPSFAQTGGNLTPPPGSQQRTAMDMRGDTKDTYVTMAGASDLYEIQSSQLALERAQSEDVRRFAQMMITDHTGTTQRIMAAARDLNMNPAPPKLMGEQAQMIQKLQTLSGAEFDKEYINQQRMAHKMALDLHSNYAQGGDAPQLQQVAKSIVPAIKQHGDMLEGMKR